MPYVGVDSNNKVLEVSNDNFPNSIYVFELPKDALLMASWTLEEGQVISEDVAEAAKAVQERRRVKREEKFEPHDLIIMKQIPDDSAAKAELERAKIREWDAELQTEIDQAFDVAALRIIMNREVL